MLRRSAAAALFVLTAVGGCGAHEPEGAPDASAPLPGAATEARVDTGRARLAAHRARFVREGGAPVLAPGLATYLATERGDGLRAVVAETRVGSAAATTVLPRRAADPVRLEDDGTHLAVDFTLRGASNSEVVVADGLALYAGALTREGEAPADVIHRAHAEGTEDFVVFERKPAREELVYDVDVSRVAGLRLVSNVLEMLDEGGTPRLRVRAPYVVDALGKTHEARTSVSGCAYDVDPSGPWGRPVTRAGATRCEVRVTWGGATDVAYPAVVDPDWTATGSLVLARYLHTATLLCAPEPCTGPVLIAGGSTGGGYTKTAELYDEGSGTFATTGSMVTARGGHTATRLSSGKVLVAAGGADLASAELFDGVGAFAATGSLSFGRSAHTATLLPSGQVLIAGGWAGTGTPVPRSTAELFDGAGTFTKTGNLVVGRGQHTATLLGSGKVLLAGGSPDGTNLLASAELFLSGSFTATGALKAARKLHTATLLGSGKVLLAGGIVGTPSAEVFDGTSAFTAVGNMTASRTYFTATALRSGKVLVAGAQSGSGGTPSVDLFDGASAFAAAAPLALGRMMHTATLLGSGRVLVAGGLANAVTQPGGTPLAELYAAFPLGQACASASYCSSGICRDRCCSAACTGSCRTCDATGACVAVKSADDPTTCNGASTCDATGTCKLKNGQPSGAASACVSGFVSEGVCCNTACAGPCDVCNAAGTIGTCTPLAAGAAGTPSCAPFVCGGAAACPTTCTLATQCSAGKVCTAGACVDPGVDAGVDSGASDAGPADASSPDTGATDVGALADGVVDAARDTGLAPDAEDASDVAADAPDVGEQTTPPVTTTTGLRRCKLDADCGGGVCVEGFCCDSACRGTCMSCVLAAAPGKCLPQPNGYDLHGDCQSSSCRSVCGGRGTCEAAVAGSQCARAQCTDQSHGKGPAVCPGLGAACPLDQQVAFDCHAYGCFAPTGTCLTECTSSDDCAPGALCDLPSKQCVVPAAANDSGGCAAAPLDANANGAAPAGGLLAFVGLAAAVARRRRARR
jgi:hypothetical protein